MNADPSKTHLAKEFAAFRPHLGCRVDPLLRYVVTGSHHNDLSRWDIAGGERVPLAGHDSWTRALAFSADGETLLSGGYDGRLIWWPIAAEKPEPARTIQAHDGWVRAVVPSPDGRQVATCGNDNLVKIWDFTEGTPVATLAGHARHAYHLAWHPSGERLVSCDLMGVIHDWDLATGQSLRQFDGQKLHGYDKVFWADAGGARGMAMQPDGARFAVSGMTEVTNAFAGQWQPLVALYDWEKPEEVQYLKAKDKYTGIAWNVAFHPDGFLVALFSGSSGASLMFFRPGEPHEFHRFKAPNQAYDMHLAADGLTVALAHYDGKLRLYRLAEKQA